MNREEIFQKDKIFFKEHGLHIKDFIFFVPKYSGVYRIYNKDKKVIYVGETGDLRERLLTHIKYIKEMEYFSYESCPTKERRYRLDKELKAIRKYNPKFNIRGNLEIQEV